MMETKMERDVAKERNVAMSALRNRRDELEAKLKEKINELKYLCMKEKELTGVLPAETPTEVCEVDKPSHNRHPHKSTQHEYPVELMNKLESKDSNDKGLLHNLQVEYIVEKNKSVAAFVMANDESNSKTLRRKHRSEFQQSQQKLNELQTRMAVLEQSMKTSHFSQRRRHRPHHKSTDVDGEKTTLTKNPSTSSLPTTKTSSNYHNNNHNFSNISAMGKSTPHLPLSVTSSNNIPTCSKDYLHTTNHLEHDVVDGVTDCVRPNNSYDDNKSFKLGYESTNIYKCDNDLVSSRNIDDFRYSSNKHLIKSNNIHYAGSSKDHRQYDYLSSYSSMFSTKDPSHINGNHYITNTASTVLLPCQTYPHNADINLIRTKSLDNVERLKHVSLDTYSLKEKIQTSAMAMNRFDDHFSSLSSSSSNAIDLNHLAKPEEFNNEFLCTKSCCPPPLHPRVNRPPERPPPSRRLSSSKPLPPSPPPPPLPPHQSSATVSPPPPPPIKSPELCQRVSVNRVNSNSCQQLPAASMVPVIVKVGSFNPSKSEEKPFEKSDVYKYSKKYKAMNGFSAGGSSNIATLTNVDDRVANQNQININYFNDEYDNFSRPISVSRRVNNTVISNNTNFNSINNYNNNSNNNININRN